MKRSLIPYFLLSLLLCVSLASFVGWWSFKAFFAEDNAVFVSRVLATHPGVTSTIEYNTVTLTGSKANPQELQAAAQAITAMGGSWNLRISEAKNAGDANPLAKGETKTEPTAKPKPVQNTSLNVAPPDATTPANAATPTTPVPAASTSTSGKAPNPAPAMVEVTASTPTSAPTPAPGSPPAKPVSIPTPASSPAIPPMATTAPVTPVNSPTSTAASTTPPATSRPKVPTTKDFTGTITEGTLELTGPIADEATRQSLLDKIKSESPDAKVIDKLVVVAGTKTPSPTAIGAIAGQLVAASGNRSFSLSENGFTMGGEVTDALLEKWAPALKSLAAYRIKRGETKWDFSPSVYHFPSRKVGEGLEPTVVGPLVEVLKANNIFFGSGRSDFKSDQRGKIAAIIEAVKAVKGNIRFIIGGHADARGDPEYNQIISQERAKNVLDALKEGGLNTENFSLEAFGPSKIVNGPPESYAASRRVEVLVR